MDPSVTHKATLVWKCLPADVTVKRLFAHVSPNMNLQVSIPDECFPTDRAAEVLLSRVTSFMPGYVACITAGVRAKATLVCVLLWPSVGLLDVPLVFQGRGPSLVIGVNSVVPRICLCRHCMGDTVNNV